VFERLGKKITSAILLAANADLVLDEFFHILIVDGNVTFLELQICLDLRKYRGDAKSERVFGLSFGWDWSWAQAYNAPPPAIVGMGVDSSFAVFRMLGAYKTLSGTKSPLAYRSDQVASTNCNTWTSRVASKKTWR